MSGDDWVRAQRGNERLVMLMTELLTSDLEPDWAEVEELDHEELGELFAVALGWLMAMFTRWAVETVLANNDWDDAPPPEVVTEQMLVHLRGLALAVAHGRPK